MPAVTVKENDSFAANLARYSDSFINKDGALISTLTFQYVLCFVLFTRGKYVTFDEHFDFTRPVYHVLHLFAFRLTIAINDRLFD